MAPCSSRNSLRWKPSGRVSRTVCSITRGPAKPISASGSAMLMSPSIAKDADTPPVVGWVITEMYGRPAARRRPSAAEVLAICISENRLSCMRAPPLAEKHTNGHSSSSARSAARAKRSPTTEPMEPPMKAKSNAQATIGCCLSVPSIATSASRSPVAFCAVRMRSEYFFWSRNRSTSVGPSEAPISAPAPGSRNPRSRARARIGRCALHLGHTSRFCSSSGRYRMAPQRSHFSHRPSGTLRLRGAPVSVRIVPGISFLIQLNGFPSVLSAGGGSGRAAVAQV